MADVVGKAVGKEEGIRDGILDGINDGAMDGSTEAPELFVGLDGTLGARVCNGRVGTVVTMGESV